MFQRPYLRLRSPALGFGEFHAGGLSRGVQEGERGGATPVGPPPVGGDSGDARDQVDTASATGSRPASARTQQAVSSARLATSSTPGEKSTSTRAPWDGAPGNAHRSRPVPVGTSRTRSSGSARARASLVSARASKRAPMSTCPPRPPNANDLPLPAWSRGYHHGRLPQSLYRGPR